VDIAIDRNYVQPGKGETVNIKVNAGAIGQEVTVKIYNLTGEFLKEIKYTTVAAGWNDINWDVKNAAGRTVGQGIYFIHIKNSGQSAIRKVYVLK
jgi:flagellar hook assembly protein FlgD